MSPFGSRSSERRLLLVCVALAALASGCDETPFSVDRDAEAAIQTDRLAYELERHGDVFETSILWTYRNTGSAPLFIQNCNGATSILLEKFEGGVWTVVWGNVVPECLSPAIALLPGQTISGDLLVSGGLPLCLPCDHPVFETSDIDGVYRLVFGEVFDSQLGNGYAAGDRVPIELRHSNRFVLED